MKGHCEAQLINVIINCSAKVCLNICEAGFKRLCVSGQKKNEVALRCWAARWERAVFFTCPVVAQTSLSPAVLVSSDMFKISFLSTAASRLADQLVFFFKKRFYLLISERGERREKDRERNTDVRKKHQLAASCVPPTRDLAHNPGMCPDWESNRQSFGLQAGAH